MNDLVNDIKENILKEHPYIMISKQENGIARSIWQLRQNAKRCPVMWNQILDKANIDLQSKPIFPDDVQGWLYDVLGRATERILRDALVFLVTQDEKYLAATKKQLWCLVDEWPWIEHCHKYEFGLNADLRTGFIMSTLGITYDWLHEYLSHEEKDRILLAIKDKGYPLFWQDYNNDAFYFKRYGNNWMSVVVGGFGIAALATVHEISESSIIAELSIKKCMKMLERVGADGGWEEGVGYWNGVVTLARYFNVLRTATSGKIDIMRDERLMNTGYFPIYNSMAPNGRADFCDSYYASDHSGAEIFPLMADITKNPHYQWAFHEYGSIAKESMEDLINRNVSINSKDDVNKFITYNPDIKLEMPSKDFPLGKLFQTDDYGFVASRNGWGRSDEGLVVISKGGNNASNHHQLDIGQVIMSCFKERYIKDLGYGKGYLDNKGNKVEYMDDFHKVTTGHNVVMINANHQINDASARGIIKNFEADNETGDSYTIDVTTAYADKCKKAFRTVLHLRPNVVAVYDQFELINSEPATLRWHYDGVAEIDQNGNFIITGNNGKCIARIVSIIDDSALLSKGVHEQISYKQRADVILPDEYHEYVKLESAKSKQHVFVSVFYFTKDMETRCLWDKTENGLELNIVGNKVVYTKDANCLKLEADGSKVVANI